MPANLIASFNALIVGGGAGKERRHGFVNARRGGDELIEEWPSRENIKRGSIKPPSSIDVDRSYSVPLRQDNTDCRPRRGSGVEGKQLSIDDHNDESSCGTTANSSLFSCSNSGNFSCYSLNDVPSSGASVRSTASRKSTNTAPGLYPQAQASRRGSNHTPMRGLRPRSSTITSTASRASVKKSVRFSDEAPSFHSYVPIAPNTHYSVGDDEYFRQYTITLARGVLNLLQTQAVRDESFDTLTGLPAAHCLRHYLNHPDIPAEEVVGIEDLLSGTGVASARKRLKKIQTRSVLVEQRRQLKLRIHDPKLLARSSRKTSAISSNIARCRAAYAAAVGD